MVRQVFEIASGIVGFVAAALWFAAGWRLPSPPVGSYYGIVDSPDMPFSSKVAKSRRTEPVRGGDDMPGGSAAVDCFVHSREMRPLASPGLRSRRQAGRSRGRAARRS